MLLELMLMAVMAAFFLISAGMVVAYTRLAGERS